MNAARGISLNLPLLVDLRYYIVVIAATKVGYKVGPATETLLHMSFRVLNKASRLYYPHHVTASRATWPSWSL